MCGILLLAEAIDDDQTPGGAGQTGEQTAAAAAEAPSSLPPPPLLPAAVPPAFALGLRRRGPDCAGAVALTAGRARLVLAASLLQLRGAAPGRAPLISPRGSVLCFNGQVFGGIDVAPGASDSEALLSALESTPSSGIPELLSALRGPWALVYFDAQERRLWFGRDWIGRRSLLLHVPTRANPRFALSSCVPMPLACGARGECGGCGCCRAGRGAAAYERWHELEPGVYSILVDDLASALFEEEAEVAEEAAEATAADPAAEAAAEPAPPAPTAAAAAPTTSASAAASPCWARVTRHGWQPGGCAEELAAYARAEHLVEPPDEARRRQQQQECAAKEGGPGTPNSSSGDNAAGGGGHSDEAFDSALRAAPGQFFDAMRDAARVQCAAIDRVHGGGDDGSGGWTSDGCADCCLSSTSSSTCNAGSGASSSSTTGSSPELLLPAAPVLVAFSGGTDSTLMAATAAVSLPPGTPVDLISVDFDGGRSPDRAGGRDALVELSAVFPATPFRFLEVDAALADVDAAAARLAALLPAGATVMDLNIGAALWLAARGEGRLVTAEDVLGERGAGGGLDSSNSSSKSSQNGKNNACPTTPQPPATSSPDTRRYVRSAARVVLLGNGADEQGVGYSRHRHAHRLGGWRGLEREVGDDVRRMWLRNLGRDDRLVADHGREARHPFLDEAVARAMLRAPLLALYDPSLPHDGERDKRVIRAALLRLGLPRAAARAKRAIQFGTRIARAANLRDFGSGRRANAVSAGSFPLAALGGVSGAMGNGSGGGGGKKVVAVNGV